VNSSVYIFKSVHELFTRKEHIKCNAKIIPQQKVLIPVTNAEAGFAKDAALSAMAGYFAQAVPQTMAQRRRHTMHIRQVLQNM